MTRLRVRVTPGAPRSGLRGWRADGALRLTVAAAPEKGRANRAVRELLAEVLHVDVSAVTVEGGAGTPSKWIGIAGLSETEVTRRIDAALEGRGSTHGA